MFADDLGIFGRGVGVLTVLVIGIVVAVRWARDPAPVRRGVIATAQFGAFLLLAWSVLFTMVAGIYAARAIWFQTLADKGVDFVWFLYLVGGVAIGGLTGFVVASFALSFFFILLEIASNTRGK
jgi:hypothetical protein